MVTSLAVDRLIDHGFEIIKIGDTEGWTVSEHYEKMTIQKILDGEKIDEITIMSAARTEAQRELDRAKKETGGKGAGKFQGAQRPYARNQGYNQNYQKRGNDCYQGRSGYQDNRSWNNGRQNYRRY